MAQARNTPMPRHQSSLSTKCVSKPSCSLQSLQFHARAAVQWCSPAWTPQLSGAKLPGTPVNAPNAPNA
eukprot:3971143-Heterocapsa_arctica.AAC.1